MHTCALLVSTPSLPCFSLLADPHTPQSFSDDEYLHRVFAEFGPVNMASITRGPQGYSKGFGFVEFARSDHATA